jgi:hypothetical protein
VRDARIIKVLLICKRIDLTRRSGERAVRRICLGARLENESESKIGKRKEKREAKKGKACAPAASVGAGNGTTAVIM